MENRGRTIAILGSGLDRLYPPENRELYGKVKECGAMVSQFSFGTEPDKRNFPVRNRVISGLSLGTVVVEAGEKSGALITAYASLEEGREVFSVPGRIDSTKSIGTNRLIQKGAKLIMSAEEVIEEFLPEVRSLIESNGNTIGRNMLSEGGGGNGNKEEDEILEHLNGVELHIDFLAEKTRLPSGILLGLLLEMELNGLVKQLPGKIYCKA